MLTCLLKLAVGAGVFIIAVAALCYAIAEYLGRKFTVVNDVSRLGPPRSESQRGKHAVVLGGGLAGILSARILLDHFHHVTIVEKDVYDRDEKRVRGAVPQGAHAHLLLAIANHAMQKLFPGIEQEFQSRGGLVSDLGKAMRWFYWGSLRVRCEMDYPFWCASRPFLDRVVRDVFFKQFGDRVTLKAGRAIDSPVLSTDIPSVREGKTPVTGEYSGPVAASEDEFRVVGVRIHRRAATAGVSASSTSSSAGVSSSAGEFGYDGVVNDVDSATVTTALDDATAKAEAAERVNSAALVAGAAARDEGHPEEVVLGDLVVDCSGTNPVSEQWAKKQWEIDVPTTIIKANAMYVSHLFEEPVDYNPDWICAPVYPTPGLSSRFGYLMRIEHKRWQITGMATAGTKVVSTEDEDNLEAFKEHFNRLDDDFIYKLLTTPSKATGVPPRAVPGERIHIYKPPQYIRRHVERCPAWPEGLLVVGNAACVFDPVYGQGMSGAAIGALSLSAALRHSDYASKERLCGNGLARAYHSILADRLAFPWMLCVGEDRRWEGIQAHGPSAGPHLFMRSLQFWIRQGMILAEKHPLAQRTAMGIMNMTVSFTSLLNPALVYLVLKNVLLESMGLTITPEQTFVDIEKRRQERIEAMQLAKEERIIAEGRKDAAERAAAAAAAAATTASEVEVEVEVEEKKKDTGDVPAAPEAIAAQ